ncbi:MAG: SAM-dependent methyltransferase [Hyphomicrobiaceae bacterium]
MSLSSRLIVAAETIPAPDFVTRAAIRYMVARSSGELNGGTAISDPDFLDRVAGRPIAAHADKANQQHYEIPAEFYALVLGPLRKYSCCLFPDDVTDLAEAEELALAETAAHADLHDGQSILELGCGWGSLSLWMARHFPNATITAVSNSCSQRGYIEGVAQREGLSNLTVITCDMNAFDAADQYDRIVSVEMFEHMSNWRRLLERVHQWLRPDGRMFLHVFAHRKAAYLFDEGNSADWIAQHFFTGGIMPSHSLIREFPDLFSVTHEWRWSGWHYEETARQWLANFDANSEQVRSVLRDVYGNEARVWHRRWRLFLLATMGLFGHAGGDEWGVSHYRLKPNFNGG